MLGTSLLLCGCSRFLSGVHESSAIRVRMRGLAGPGAIYCGDNLLPNLIPKNNACAIGAMTEHAPFYIVWNIPTGSSMITRGIAMNRTGEMFMLSETHEPSGGHFTTTLCPAQSLVPDSTITTTSVLTCKP